ncbi:MAG TPA: SgcJ/EcaC family oxidoreductase [Actinoallomurus sp.]|jgi:uncharacterized protein (TIGR02246 family)
MTMDLNEQVTAVHAVFDATSSAWADGDADAFVDWYAEDATVILPGFALRGRADIRTNMGDAFAGPLKGSKRLHVVQDVRFLGEDTALVVTRSVTTFPREAESPAGQQELATWALSRHEGRWLVEAYHSCAAGPDPAA